MVGAASKRKGRELQFLGSLLRVIGNVTVEKRVLDFQQQGQSCETNCGNYLVFNDLTLLEW